MAAAERTSDAHLTLLQQQGEELNFYQAIRVLERALPPGEGLRFSVVNSDAFHPNFIASIKHTRRVGQDPVTRIGVNGFGLLGMQGPLPSCFSELLLRAEVSGKEGQETPQAFLDIFHDRLLELLYDIKQQLNPMLFNQMPEQHLLFTLMASVSGLSLQSVPVKPDRLVGFAPILANRRVDYSHIVSLIREFLGYRAEVIPNQGGWSELPQTMQARLSSEGSQTDGIRLGTGMGLGKTYWDNQIAIGIIITVDDIDACHRLLPGGDEHNKLKTMLTFLSDGRYRCHTTIKLDWDQVPESRLGKRHRLKLGQSAWLKHTKVRQEQRAPSFVVHPDLVECDVAGGLA